MKPVITQWKMNSKIGPLYLVASDKGLQGVFWEKQEAPSAKDLLKGSSQEIKVLAQAVSELEQYLDGERKVFSVPLDVDGTEFQKRVWAQLLKIPYGKTYSYKEIADRLQSKAIRAVGSANGRNPLCIIVPCHRVIASDGSLGGYSGGLEIKAKLLELELAGN